MKFEDGIKTMVRGAGILFIGILISKALGYFFKLIVARIGPTQYGLLSLGIAVLSILTMLSLLGTNQGIIRYVSYYRGKKEKTKIENTIASAALATIPLSIALSIILFLYSDWISVNLFHNIELSLILKIFAIVVPLDVLRNVIFSTMRAFQKIKYEVFSKHLSENTTKVALVAILVYLGYGVVGASFAYLFAIFVSAMLAIYFLNKHIFPIHKLNNFKFNKELLNFSFPLLFNLFAILIIIWTDTLMLGYFKTAYDVGIYNAAIPTSQLMTVFPLAALGLFLPVLTELYSQRKKEDFTKIYKTATKWVFMTNLILLAIFALFSKQILTVLFGTEYALGAAVLVILAFGYFVYTMTLTSNHILLTYKKSNLVLLATAVGASVNIILNYLLIPKYNFLGAGIATGLSLVIAATLIATFAYNTTKINWFKLTYFKIIFSLSIPLIVLYLFSKVIDFSNILMLILGAMVFLVMYGILLLATKSIGKKDIELIKMVQQKTNLKLKFLNKMINFFNK